MKNITLKELAEQRIGEFTDALRKYILDEVKRGEKMSEKMTTANSAEQGVVDIDYAECAVPKWSRRRIYDNVYDHAWIYLLFRKHVGRTADGSRT